MNIRIFKTKYFAKWQDKELITDQDLIKSVSEMEKGLIDANLGGNIYKKRVAKRGQGKSGSFRTIIAFKIYDKAFFIHGFAKNEKDNINIKELHNLKLYASLILGFDKKQIKEALIKGELLEVQNG